MDPASQGADELFAGLYENFVRDGARAPMQPQRSAKRKPEDDSDSDGGSVVDLQEPFAKRPRAHRPIPGAVPPTILAPPQRHWSKVATAELRGYVADLFSIPGESSATRTERFRSLQAHMAQPPNVDRWLGLARRGPAKNSPEIALPITADGAVRAHDALATLASKQPSLRIGLPNLTRVLAKMSPEQLQAMSRHAAEIAPTAFVLGLDQAQVVAALPDIAAAHADAALHDAAGGDAWAGVACLAWKRRTLHEGLQAWHASDVATDTDSQG